MIALHAMMNHVALIFASLVTGAICVLLAAHVVLMRRLARTHPARNFSVRGVSILKPLKGADEGLRENLLAMIDQDYPQFEIIFASADASDPALEVARSLARSHPHRDIQILSGEWSSGLNPKVRLLRRMLPSASYDWVLVSDSNVRPDPGYLTAIVAEAEQTGASLVHSVLVGAGGRSLGGRLEELHLCSWVAASIALADWCGHACVIGKSMLMQLDALTTVGGFAGVQDVLAEDYILGTRFQKAGYRVALSPHALQVVTGCSPWQNFWNRHVRWSQMRRRISPLSYCAELFANPTPLLLIQMCISQGTLQVFSLILLLLKWAVDAVTYIRLAPSPSWQTVSLMVLKDLLVPVIWFVGLLRRTVKWRGNVVRVGPGSQLFPLEESRSAHLGLVDEQTVQA